MILWSILFSIAMADSAIPPKVLYHVGGKATLQRDEGNVPEADWNKFIMGTTRFKSAPFRRGLYGGEEFAPIDSYATNKDEDFPWGMSIYLKEECRQEAAVSDLKEDPKFGQWVVANVARILRFKDECLNLEASDCSNLFYHTGMNGGRGNECDKLAADFFQAKRIRVVKDVVPGAWYIRDRSCIEAIRTSGDEMLRTLTEADWNVTERKKGTYCRKHSDQCGRPTLFMLIGALGEAKETKAEQLNQLRAKVAGSDIVMNGIKMSETATAWIDAFDRCERKKSAAFRQENQRLVKALHERSNRFGEGFGKLIRQSTATVAKLCL